MGSDGGILVPIKDINIHKALQSVPSTHLVVHKYLLNKYVLLTSKGCGGEHQKKHVRSLRSMVEIHTHRAQL